MSRRRSSRGLGPLVFVFGSLASFFADLVAYCVAGWVGVLVATAVMGLVIWAIASEVTASAERQARADENWARHYAMTYDYTAPQRRGRRKGGAR